MNDSGKTPIPEGHTEDGAIQFVLYYGRIYGFGNLIHHLKLEWKKMLLEKFPDLSEKAAGMGALMWESPLVRGEVEKFAMEMEGALRRQDDLKGESWRAINIDSLLKAMDKDVNKLKVSENTPGETGTLTPVERMKEAVDIANRAMMLYHRAKSEVDDDLRE